MKNFIEQKIIENISKLFVLFLNLSHSKRDMHSRASQFSSAWCKFCTVFIEYFEFLFQLGKFSADLRFDAGGVRIPRGKN